MFSLPKRLSDELLRDRSEFGTAIHSFFVNIRLVGEIAHQKSSRSPDSTDDPHITEITERLKTFQSWLLDEYLNPLLHLARRPCIARAILALSVLTVYLDVFGGDFDVHKAVFTSERAEDLLACQASEYSEVRQKARAM